MIKAEQIWGLAPQVEWQPFENNALLIHLDTGEIFALNETGMRIVELLQLDLSVGEVQDVLVGEFQQEPTVIASEVLQFFSQCQQRALIVCLSDGDEVST